MSTYATTSSTTFTIVHARHLASKIGTDLKRIQRFYANGPSDAWIQAYEAEAIELMQRGFLQRVIYGFKRNGSWIEPTVRYEADELHSGSSDDDPGRISPGKDVDSAIFTSFLSYTDAWHRLSAQQQAGVKGTLPFQRSSGIEPSVSGGSYFDQDKTYSAGGRALVRGVVRSY